MSHKHRCRSKLEGRGFYITLYVSVSAHVPGELGDRLADVAAKYPGLTLADVRQVLWGQIVPGVPVVDLAVGDYLHLKRSGARPGTGHSAASRGDGAAAAGPGALPVLRAHPHRAAVLVRAPARRRDRSDRHRAGRSAGRGGLRADRRGPGRARPGPCAAGCAACAPARRRCAASPCASWGAIGGAGPALPEPASSPLHDALNAVAAVAQAAITGHGFGPRTCGRCWAASAWPGTSCPSRAG